jgi:GcrA cell cycle regulator
MTAFNPNHHWPKQQTDALIEMFNLGHTFSEIAKRLSRMFGVNVSRSACLGKIKRLGIKRNVSQGSNSPLKALAEMQRKDRRCETIEENARSEMLQSRPLSRSTSDAVLALKPNSCRYPIGDVGHEGFRFCGEPKEVGSSYCAEHQSLCTTSTKKMDLSRS